jgi:hypothetical protein
MIRTVFLIIWSSFLLSGIPALAQELEFTVTVDRTQVPDLPKNITDDLQSSILNFINNRRWTNDQFSPQERIKGNILITLDKSTSLGRYISTTQIQIVRPIYGTTYESVMLNFIDKTFNFEFAQGQPMDYNENIYMSNIVSMVSFYAYIALALDYDSFGKMGGSPYVEKAFNIANTTQAAGPPVLTTSGGSGWEANEFSSRMSLINQLNNQQFTPFREGLYIYHREAMDKFLENPDEARKKIIEVLKMIKTTRQVVPISILVNSFFIGKRDELIQVFSKAPTEMKTEVVNLLRELDGINSEKYATILRNN